MNYFGKYKIGIKELSQPLSFENKSYVRKFIFSEPVDLSDEAYLCFDKENNVPLKIKVGDKSYLLPETKEKWRFAFFLSPDVSLREFSLESEEYPQLGNFSIINNYNQTEFPVLLFKDDTLQIEVSDADLPFYFQLDSDSLENQENVLLKLEFDNSTNEYNIRTRSGENPYWIYKNKDTQLKTILLDTENVALKEIKRFDTVADNKGLPMDLEAILYRSPSEWRQNDYELYSWNDFPGMLIIDTVNYSVQSDFFKRMAFYTEKKGSAGKLLTDRDLTSLHGWNAHDYRAADLARFFNKALEINFQLNDRENALKEMLLANGVLRESSGSYSPGKGGILSISRESNERLRYLFLTHECYHGIFFSSNEYAQSVHNIWFDLSDEERNFWRYFLDMYGYNVDDEYLLINEFQAYLMQQDTEKTDSYFRGKINWMVSLRPNLLPEMSRLLRDHGQTFTNSAKKVENAAFSITGVTAGDLVLKSKK